MVFKIFNKPFNTNHSTISYSKPIPPNLIPKLQAAVDNVRIKKTIPSQNHTKVAHTRDHVYKYLAGLGL